MEPLTVGGRVDLELKPYHSCRSGVTFHLAITLGRDGLTVMRQRVHDFAGQIGMLPRIHPLPGTFGARVSSLDLDRLTSEGRERLSAALGQYLLLIFKRILLYFLAKLFFLQVKGVISFVGDQLLLSHFNCLVYYVIKKCPVV